MIKANEYSQMNLDSIKLPCLEEILQDCVEIMNLGIRNNYTLALDRATQMSSISIYHSLLRTIFHLLKVALTLEKDDINRALESSKETSDLCDKYRRPQTIVSSVWKYLATPDYTIYAEEELHAELLKATNHMIFGLLTFFSDHSIISLVKGAIRLQTGHSLMKSCSSIAEQDIDWQSQASRSNFMSGIHLCLGMINLALSHLPDKIITLLSWAGYSSDRQLAHDHLNKCANIDNTIYCLPIKIIDCFYETLVNNVIGARKVDLNKISYHVNKEIAVFDKNAWFLLIKAQVLKFAGDLDNAIIHYHQCIEAQDDLAGLHNFCFWDLSFCHAFKFEWDQAIHYADLLFEKTNWSKATNLYMKGAYMYMKMIQENKPELKEQVDELFRLVPQYKVRIAGKTIPQEKYVCVNAEKYFKQNESLPLPVLDLFYIWNFFCSARLNPKLVDPMIELVDKSLAHYANKADDVKSYQDNYYQLLFIKGVCLKFRRKYSKAEKCFKEIINSDNLIKEERHLLPWTMLELGLSKMNSKSNVEAEHWLRRAKNNYSGYLFEMMILMKIHSALQRLKDQEHISEDQDHDDCI